MIFLYLKALLILPQFIPRHAEPVVVYSFIFNDLFSPVAS